jgi:hypothetical protein
MTDEIRNSRPTDQADADLTTADLAGTSQKTPSRPNDPHIETESQPVGSPRGPVSTDRGRAGTQGALPLLRWTKKLRRPFRAARRTIFARDGMLYKSVLLTNRAELSSKPTSWSQEQ